MRSQKNGKRREFIYSQRYGKEFKCILKCSCLIHLFCLWSSRSSTINCGVGLVGVVPKIDLLTNDQPKQRDGSAYLREEMLGADHINLVPPVVELGRFHDLVKAGQTVSASFSPSSNSLAVFLTNTVCLLHPESAFVCVTHSLQGPLDKNKSHTTDDDQPVYFAGLDVAPSSERRLVSATINISDLHNLELYIVPYRYPHYICCFPKSSQKRCNTRGRLVGYDRI